MFQIDNSTAVAAIPGPTPPGAAGYFTDGNPATGVSATILPAEFMNMLMMENINVLVAAGIQPDKSKHNQLSLAIAKIVGGSMDGALRAAVVNSSSGTTFESKVTGAIGSSGWDAKTALTISNGGIATASAVMTFLRGNSHGFHLGVDTDNKFKRGGVSLGANSYEIWDEFSLPLATQVQAEAGTHPKSVMTPAGVAQAISKRVVAASGSAAGIAAIASQPEVDAGADDQKIVTPKKLKERLSAWFTQATEMVLGAVRLATQVQVDNGVDDSSAVTPSKLKALLDIRGLWAASRVVTDLDAELTTGVYSASGPAIVPDGGLFQVFNTRSGGDPRWQSQLLMGIASSRIFYRSKGNYAGALSPLVEFYSTGNCYLVGASVGFYRDTAPPGFLKENGAAVSRTTYAALFAAIGTKFGAGDGVTTFNLPDSRALFSRALDDNKGIDVGRQMGSTQIQSIQSHNHVILGKATNFVFSAPAGGNAPGSGTTGATEVAGGTETRPANIAKLYCIKF
ncbi:tail fiber protein [Pseudomonas brenneri]|uniref:tail fiber protein n=1 Tax=Pseudomonas brenneri TaxID=129817 RepID=UPI0035710698